MCRLRSLVPGFSKLLKRSEREGEARIPASAAKTPQQPPSGQPRPRRPDRTVATSVEILNIIDDHSRHHHSWTSGAWLAGVSRLHVQLVRLLRRGPVGLPSRYDPNYEGGEAEDHPAQNDEPDVAAQ